MDSTKSYGTNDNTKKKCPYSDRGNENESIRKMPYKRWFGFWNMMQYLRDGHTYYERMDKEYNSTVYKIHFSEDQTVLNDHESIKICYDPEKVDKQAGLSFINFNPIMLRGYVPTMYLNGTEHEERKAAMMEYLSYIQESVSIDNIMSMVEEEFKKMPSFKDLSDEKANEYDIEKVLSDAVENVVTKVLLGDTIDHDLIEKWSVGTSEFQYSFKFFSRSDENTVTDNMFKAVEATPNILNLGNIIKSSTLEKDELIRQIVWMTMFNGAGSIRNLAISTLIALLQVSDEEQLIIVEESKSFFSSNNKDMETLSSLKTVHQLFLEVCRLFPPAPTVYRKPKDDCVIQSTSGRFELERGGLISGKLMGVHRDPELYENPKEISLNRDIKIIEENIFTLGGKFNEIPTPTNFKCPGQSFGIIITKLFMMYLTKCLVVPVSDFTYTGSNLLRLIGSDKPLKVKTFSYQE